jgi:signal transduction histidine kinase
MRVLVIDDDADTCANLRDILELDGCEVDTAATAAEALRRKNWPELSAVLLDRKLPDGTAEQLLPQLKRLAPQAAMLIITGHHDLEGAIAAIREGAADYLVKPVNADLIRSRVAGIIERRRAEDEIHRLNRDMRLHLDELRTLLEVVPIGIAMADDPECRKIRINPALARLLRLPPSAHGSLITAIPEEPLYKICHHGRELPPNSLPMQVAAASGIVVHAAELEVVHPDGATTHLLAQAAPLLDDQGKPRGAVGAFLDVTDHIRAQERALQMERLAAIGQMMTGLAHESGNALARSRACLDMLTWEVQDRPESLGLIDRIQKAQDHLQQLYEEVRGYAAPLKLEREPADLGSIWRRAWDHLALRRQGRDTALNETVDGVDLQCAIDQFRLEQVFRNILENSLAACPGAVQIQVHCRPAELQGRPALRISIRDNGPGFTPVQRQRVFEPFFTTKTKGTGLGMPIAKRIIEAHGGTIAVGDGPDPGAEIVLTLPREAS